MVSSILIASAAILFPAPQAQPIACPITGEPVVNGMKVTEYNGARFTYCCAGCDEQFEKNPQAALDKSIKSGKTVGEFLFDPISKKRIEPKKADGGSSDYHGLRFYFESKSNKAAFDKEPQKFGALPKKEALFCPVTKEAVSSYGKSVGYEDYQGVRYYFCCAGCDGPFSSDPGKYAPNAKSHVQTPKAMASEPDKAKGGGGARP